MSIPMPSSGTSGRGVERAGRGRKGSGDGLWATSGTQRPLVPAALRWLRGHQFNVTSGAVALPKGNHRRGGPEKAANGSNQTAQIFAATCFQNWGDWSESAPDASRAVCCANFLSEAISESVNGPHSAEKVAFSCCEAFAAESN